MPLIPLFIVSGNTALVIQDATSASSADNVLLSQTHILTVQDATSGSSADNVILSQKHILIVQDVTSPSSADNVVLGGAVVLEIQDAFSSSSADNVILAVTSTIRGHKKRHRKRKIIYWDEVEKLNQEKIEEAVVEIIKEEKKLDKERIIAEQTKAVVKNQIKLKQLQKKIQDIEEDQVFLQRQKELVLKQIEFLQEEDDMEAILMML